MERRYIVFIALSLAAVMGSQALRAVLFPKPPAAPQEEIAAREAAAPERAAADAAVGDPVAKSADDGAEVTSAREHAAGGDAAADEQSFPRVRCTLGSLDPDAPSKMLVTLTSRGAAVERIELSGNRFHDQDDRSGYLGHTAPVAVDGGCRLLIVGPGTPADRAGLRSGDVVRSVAGMPTPDPKSLALALAKTRPGQKIPIDASRGGAPLQVTATLGWRPLEVVRPEYMTRPVDDPDVEPCDPLSFRLSLEERKEGEKGGRRAGPLEEIAGNELWDTDWETAVDSETTVRFTRRLPGGLLVRKTYRLAAAEEQVEAGKGGPPEADAANRLELIVEFVAEKGPCSVAYALDGPTGLPTEGWWYASRIARDWGSLGVRDPAVRFAGEPSRLTSSLNLSLADKLSGKSVDPPASAVRDDKPLSFAGVDALYFTSAVLPSSAEAADAPRLAEFRPLVVGSVPDPGKKKLVNVTSRLVSREIAVEPGAAVVQRFGIFAGPKQPDLLAGFGLENARMDDLVYYGWFGWVARPMVALLHALHAVTRNYGIAIILLTVMVRGAMFPISRKQALSSQKMQALQPEMKAISEKYKNEPEKRTRATQELWKKHDYNPMGGCLLVFIQIPIFMGLYRSLATDVELRQAPLFTSAIRWCSNLAAPDMLYDWSKVLPAFLTTPEGWLGPFLNVFPLLTIGLFLWQQKLFMPPAVDEQSRVQQQVMKYMMFFMALMFFKVPCGLCLYFIASSLWGIAERIWLPVGPAAATVAATPLATQAMPKEKSAAGRIVEAVLAKADNARSQASAGNDRRKGRSRGRK